MIILNKEMAYINFYLTEKEYFLPDKLRKALNYIYYLNREKGKDIPLAIHITNEIYNKKYNIDYTKEFLWKRYRGRLAHIKNAKDKFKIWSLELREKNAGIIKVCECGCGKEVTNKKNRFINGHNAKCRDKEENIEKAAHMRNMREQKKSRVIIQFPKKP